MDEKAMSGRDKLEEAFRRYELSLDEKYPPADVAFEASDDFEEFIENLRKKLDKKERCCKFYKAFGKRIVAAVVAFFIIGGVTVYAFREPVAEFLTKVYDKFVEIFFNPDDISEAPKEIETVYTLGYVPEGYELVWRSVDKLSVLSIWKNEQGEVIKLEQRHIKLNTKLDNEEVVFEIIYSNRYRVAVKEIDEKKTFVWNTDEYAFVLIGTEELSEGIFIDIIDSLRMIDINSLPQEGEGGPRSGG